MHHIVSSNNVVLMDQFNFLWKLQDDTENGKSQCTNFELQLLLVPPCYALKHITRVHITFLMF